MKIFFITCNGNLINYKPKYACNTQLLYLSNLIIVSIIIIIM